MTLYTNSTISGALTMQREQLVMPIETMSKPTLSVGNTIDSALPCLSAEFTSPQLMPKQHVLGAIDELARKAGNKALRDHYDQLMGTIQRQWFTHYWVA